MTPYHSDPWLTVYQGDCREVMAALEQLMERNQSVPMGL